jgi:NADH-quinone oxidoreductase subunit C
MSGPDPAAQQVVYDAAVAASFAHACGIGAAEIQASRDGAGTLVVDVPVAVWVGAAAHARDGLEMDFLDWLSAVDAPDADPPGLDVVLHVAATGSAGEQGGRARFLRQDSGSPYVQRLLLRTHVPDAGEGMPALASLTALWPGVAWHERETFEMFGLQFTGFDDGSGQPIRPLLLPEGFEGTPLRKSFMLAARAAKAWPGAKDPADSSGTAGGKSPSRRKILPPGVPDPSWGPRAPQPAPADLQPAPADLQPAPQEPVDGR